MVLGLAARASGIVALTAVETGGLTLWLAVAQGTLETALPGVVGPVLLAGALVAEAALLYVTVTGRPREVPVGPILVFALVEVVLWVTWLAVARAVGGSAGVLVASGLLALALVPKHTVEDNVLERQPLRSDLTDPGTVRFSLVEGAAAAAWLTLFTRGDRLLGDLGAVGGDVVAAGVPAGVPDLPAAGACTSALAAAGVLAALLLVEHVLLVRHARQ